MNDTDVRPDVILTAIVPIATVSEMNRRDHWSERHRRAKQQKELTLLMLRTAKVDRSRLIAPYSVRLTRIAPGAIRDSDNLAASTKAVRDAVASFLGVDDADVFGSGDVRWTVAQEKGASHALRIEIATGSCADMRSAIT